MGLAVFVVFVSGIYYSPITSLSKYEVVGARSVDRPRIDTIVGKLKSVPYFRVNGHQVESEVRQIEAIDRAEYTQNIFGRGRLTVAYRTPIAIVKSTRKIGMDAKGVLFETDALPAKLPTVVLPESATELPLTMLGPFPSGAVVELATRAKEIDSQASYTIGFDSKGALCLNVGRSKVIFGAADEIDKKLKALKEILDEEPNLLKDVQSLNLTEPSHPARTYKKQRE